jgi:hypothetical protein
MHLHFSRHFPDTPCPNPPPNAVEGELQSPDEPMPFNDRPYLRRLLDFDDLKHNRERPVELSRPSNLTLRREGAAR